MIHKFIGKTKQNKKPELVKKGESTPINANSGSDCRGIYLFDLVFKNAQMSRNFFRINVKLID
jgi:hypothetical protein